MQSFQPARHESMPGIEPSIGKRGEAAEIRTCGFLLSQLCSCRVELDQEELQVGDLIDVRQEPLLSAPVLHVQEGRGSYDYFKNPLSPGHLCKRTGRAGDNQSNAAAQSSSSSERPS